MKQRFILLLAFVHLAAAAGAQQTLTPAQYREDFDALWTTVQEQYGYWPEKKTGWNCVRERYRPRLDTMRSRYAFTLFLENVLRELYDQHMSLNTNTAASYRLVPTGADIALRLSGNRAFVSEVRPRSGAEKAGIRPGMELVGVNGRLLEEAITPLLPQCLLAPDSAARLYALQLLAAGTHRDPRSLTLSDGHVLHRNVRPDSLVNIDTLGYDGLLERRVLEGNVGYIGLHNSLGDENLIPAFDSVLNGLMNTRALIIDLRETPSGGTSTVARAIMGRLLQREGYYQRHELPADSGRWGVKRSWVEIVVPRGKAYTQPV
ncbi:MAG: hypothetical protein EOO12_13950, partial [Chitinophagaceae bacterium]